MDSTLVNVLVTSHFPTVSLRLPGHLPASSTLAYILSPFCDEVAQSLSLNSGLRLPAGASFSSLQGEHVGQDVYIRMAVRLPGGKGGFGSQLRAAGGRMNSKRNGQNNTDSCRDLNGRRLSTIKEAKKLADALQAEPEREAARVNQAKERLAKLQDEIARLDGQIASASTTVTPAAGPSSAFVAGSSQSAGGPPAGTPATIAGGAKRRLDDQKYIEESREIVDNVKNAVAAAMMKKRKLNKAAAVSTSDSSESKGKQTENGSTSVSGLETSSSAASSSSLIPTQATPSTSTSVAVA